MTSSTLKRIENNICMCLPKAKLIEPEHFHQSIDNPVQLPKVLLFWTKERATLEKEVQLFIQDGKRISLLWSEKDARFQTKTQLFPGGHDGWLSVNDINLSADINTFYVAPYQRGTKMQEIELAIDGEKEELLKEFLEKKEKENEKEGVDKLNKPKNINSNTLVGTDGTQKNILIEDSKKVENDELTADPRDQINKLTKDNHILKKQIVNNNTKIEETEREQLEGEKQALLITSKGLKRELDNSLMICDSLREELLLYRESTAPPPRIPIPTTTNSPPPPPMATLSSFRKRKHPGDTPPLPLQNTLCVYAFPQSPLPILLLDML